MRGIQSVSVRLFADFGEATPPGVDTAAMRTHVELRLREARLRVVPYFDGQAALIIEIHALQPSESGLIAYAEIFHFQQHVIIDHPPRSHMVAETWSAHYLGLAGAAQVSTNLTDITDRLLDQMLNLILAVN